MNLVILTAVIAVCGAAKLDRTYLPPSSAANAGGSPGSLQTPHTRSSDQGLDSPRLPSGSYTNDFGDVVVDAASPGTRASVDADQSNLGGPRPSYGSTDSKVGDAAFRGTAGFRDASFGSQGQRVAESLSNSQVDGHNGQFSSQNSNGQFSSQNSNGQFSNGQVSSFENKSERPQAAKDRNSNILALSNDVDADRYSYGFETDNGIAVGENGVAVNGIQAEGGYSYQGDDGQVYKVTYTADEGGYRPQGAHLPTPPPIPEEILKSLEQNAKEEAAGIVDDGSYDAQKYNTEGDYTNDNSGNIQHNGGQLSLFGKRPESDATASGSFINQNGQAFRQPGLGQVNLDQQNSHFNSQASQSNGISGQFITGTQNGNFALNGQSSQGNGNSAFGQFSSQPPIVAESSQTNEKSGQFGGSGTQYNQQLSHENSQHGTAHHQNTQEFLNGQTNQGTVPQDASSSHNSGTLSAQYSGNIQNSQIPGNHMSSSSSQGQSSFEGFNNLGSHASASAQVQNQSPNSESQQTQQGFNTQLSSEPEMTQPQFGSSFKPQGSEAFSGASLDQEQDGQDFGKPSPHFSGQNFNRPNTPTGQVPANKFSSGTNIFNKISQSSSQVGGQNEYLPPNASQQQLEQLQASNGFNSNLGSTSFNAGSNRQVSTFNKPISNFTPQNRQKPSLASASASTSLGKTTFQAQPARPVNAYNSQTQASQPKPNQFTQQSSRFGQQDQFSSQKPQIDANSQQSASFSQTGQEQLSLGTKPTSIPDTELTTPLEPNETPAYSQGSKISTQTTPSFGSFNSKPSSNAQAQAQFGFQGNYAFGQQSSQSLTPSFPTSTPSALQSPSVGNNPNKSFSKPLLPQISFAQTQSPSNQGADSSYYYNQPSQPFGLTANRPQSPRFPSSSSYQSNGIASQTINRQNSFSGKLPGSQFAPVAPTATSQFNQQQNYNGITQAAISSFPSPPTPSQLGTAHNSQFGSKPTITQQSFGNQGQALKPVFNQQTTFGSKFQTSGSQQSRPTFAQGQSGFPSQPVSQFGQKPSSGFQTENKFGQSGQIEQSQITSGLSTTFEEKPTLTQQYQGTIYEYNKPAQVLPAPTQTDSSSSQSIQSGVAVERKPSFGQQNNQLTQQNQSGKTDFESDAQVKPFASASATQFGQFSQSHQVNKFGSQSGLTNNQFGNTGQASQFGLSPQQQNVQGSQQPFKPFGFNSQSSFGLKPQSGSQTSQFSQNTQTLVNSQTSQPVGVSSQSLLGSSTFGNAVSSQNNGYFYPNPTSQFPENPQSIRPQSALNQNTQNPFAQALFTASQQTAQSSNTPSELTVQSSQTGQNTAQFSQKSPNSLIQPFGQSTASSQAVASGQATASASASLQQPINKSFGSQNRNQFSLNNNDAQGQSTQQVAVQNLQTVGNSHSDDSLKPHGALSSRPGASTAELPKPLFSSACCQASKDSTPAQSADTLSQSGFQGFQNINAQSFAGKGEEFGGPRQPPKFDETGYHY